MKFNENKTAVQTFPLMQKKSVYISIYFLKVFSSPELSQLELQLIFE